MSASVHYQRPRAQHTPEWRAARAWWLRLSAERRLEVMRLVGRPMALIVAYHARGGR